MWKAAKPRFQVIQNFTNVSRFFCAWLALTFIARKFEMRNRFFQNTSLLLTKQSTSIRERRKTLSRMLRPADEAWINKLINKQIRKFRQISTTIWEMSNIHFLSFFPTFPILYLYPPFKIPFYFDFTGRDHKFCFGSGDKNNSVFTSLKKVLKMYITRRKLRRSYGKEEGQRFPRKPRIANSRIF